MQVLTATQIISDSFPNSLVSGGASFFVRLQGTVNADWDIESAAADATTPVWESDTGSLAYSVDDKTSGVHVYGKGLIYRINLGSGNQGPIGTIHNTATQIYR